MTREEFNEKARRDAAEFRKELADRGVEKEVAVHDTDEDYFIHLVNEAVCCAYSSHPQVLALGDLKALLLLGIDASVLRRLEAAFTPENTGEAAYREYFKNVIIPRLMSLEEACPPEVRAKVVQELEGAAPPHCTFRDLLRDTYRAHPGLNLRVGGPELIARQKSFLLRVEEVLNPSKAKRGGKRRASGGRKRGRESEGNEDKRGRE